MHRVRNSDEQRLKDKPCEVLRHKHTGLVHYSAPAFGLTTTVCELVSSDKPWRDEKAYSMKFAPAALETSGEEVVTCMSCIVRMRGEP